MSIRRPAEIVREIADGTRLAREFTELVNVPDRDRNMVMVP